MLFCAAESNLCDIRADFSRRSAIALQQFAPLDLLRRLVKRENHRGGHDRQRVEIRRSLAVSEPAQQD